MKTINYFKFGLITGILLFVTACKTENSSNNSPYMVHEIYNKSSYDIELIGENNNTRGWYTKVPGGNFHGASAEKSIEMDIKYNKLIEPGVQKVSIEKDSKWSFDYFDSYVNPPTKIGSSSKLVIFESYSTVIKFASNPARCFTFGIVGSDEYEIDSHDGFKDPRSIDSYFWKNRYATSEEYDGKSYLSYKITDEMYDQATICE